jgi:hypothetical protein
MVLPINLYICNANHSKIRTMTRIAGLNYDTDAKGQIYKVTFDLRKIRSDKSSYIEDIIDLIEINALKEEETVSGQEVFNRLGKKHGIRERRPGLV